jgi:predicted outer membrane protein
MRIIYLFALLPLACASGPTNPAVSRDTATQINRDRRYSHASNGDIVLGPVAVNERVVGQRDAAGNIHVTTDRWFLQRAAELTRAQLSLASLARQRSASPEVIQLADRTASENQLIDQRVRDLARRRNMAVVDRLGSDESNTLAQVASLDGGEFDRAYIDAAQTIDREQLALWDDVLRSSGDQQVAQLAFDTLPALRAADQQAAATSTRM